jgi:hypothetical protein
LNKAPKNNTTHAKHKNLMLKNNTNIGVTPTNSIDFGDSKYDSFVHVNK